MKEQRKRGGNERRNEGRNGQEGESFKKGNGRRNSGNHKEEVKTVGIKMKQSPVMLVPKKKV